MGIIPLGWLSQVLVIIANVPLYTLTPRFVVNVRQLYVLDTQGRVNRDIDTGFGLSSGVSVPTTIETIAFEEGGRSRRSDDGEEIVTVDRAVESSGRQASVA